MKTEQTNTEQVAQEQVQTPVEHFSEKMDEILSDKGEATTETKESIDTNKEETLSEDEQKEIPDGDSLTEGNEQTQDETVIDEKIDPEVLQIFSDYGLSEDTIKQIAQESPELLKSVKKELEVENQQVKKPVEKSQSNQTPKSKFKEIKVNIDAELVGADVKNAIDSIVAALNEQGKGLESETTKLQQERDNAFQARIDGHFDKYSKQVADIGDSSSLTEQQYKTRLELFRHATITSEIRGIPIQKAIEIEVNKHKNQYGDKVASQKLIDKLGRQKQHFTNPPTRRQSDISTRKFATEEERKLAVMTEGYKEAGIEE